MFTALAAAFSLVSLAIPAQSAVLPATFGVPYASDVGTYTHPNTALLIVDHPPHHLRAAGQPHLGTQVYPFTAFHMQANAGCAVVATSQDWHPEGHVSFASAHPGHAPGDVIQIPVLASRYNETARQSLTYDHCVPGTFGAEIEAGVQSRLDVLYGKTPITQIHKAQHHLVDSYSAFADNQYFEFTTLGPEMRARGIEEIVVVGLITNSCVYGSTVDGIKMGWDVTVISDGVETTTQAKQDESLAELKNWWGATVLSLKEFSCPSSTHH
ncbi:Isochorismatase-like protein [Mycena vulgaris]|nr:Isochorismatase-like protein [Mycena vulgaris]